MEYTTIVIAIIGLTSTLIPAYWVHKEKKKNNEKDKKIAELESQLTEANVRTEVVDRLLDITLLSEIKTAVDVVFQETSADRYLILIALNGVTDFNMISVIFEQHKGVDKISAIARYRNLKIDDEYKSMLKKAERNGDIELEVSQMPDESILKQIYMIEGVQHSKVTFLLRKGIDSGNDVIVFSSLATHSEEPFSSRDKTIASTQNDAVIVPALKLMIESTNPYINAK